MTTNKIDHINPRTKKKGFPSSRFVAKTFFAMGINPINTKRTPER
tara:strand:+ start:1526 stop:1660 length:135 start_codon:yes stop_codon:yes gene_type:complete